MTESRFAKRTWKASRWWATFYHNLKEKKIYEYHDFYSDLVWEFLLIYRWVHNREGKKLKIASGWRFLPMRYNPEVIVSLMILRWFYHYNHPVKELTNRDLVMIWWLAFDGDLQYAKTFKEIFSGFVLEKQPKSYTAYFSTTDLRDYDPLDKNSFQKHTKYISKDFFKQSLDKVLLHIQGDYRPIERYFKWRLSEKYINNRLDFIINWFKAFVNSLGLWREFLAKNELSERKQLKWKTDFEIIASTIDNIMWYDYAPELERMLETEKSYYENNYESMTEEQRILQRWYIAELEVATPDDFYDELSIWNIRNYLYDSYTRKIDKLLLWETDKDYMYIYW